MDVDAASAALRLAERCASSFLPPDDIIVAVGPGGRPALVLDRKRRRPPDPLVCDRLLLRSGHLRLGRVAFSRLLRPLQWDALYNAEAVHQHSSGAAQETPHESVASRSAAVAPGVGSPKRHVEPSLVRASTARPAVPSLRPSLSASSLVAKGVDSHHHASSIGLSLAAASGPAALGRPAEAVASPFPSAAAAAAAPAPPGQPHNTNPIRSASRPPGAKLPSAAAMLPGGDSASLARRFPGQPLPQQRRLTATAAGPRVVPPFSVKAAEVSAAGAIVTPGAHGESSGSATPTFRELLASCAPGLKSRCFPLRVPPPGALRQGRCIFLWLTLLRAEWGGKLQSPAIALAIHFATALQLPIVVAVVVSTVPEVAEVLSAPIISAGLASWASAVAVIQAPTLSDSRRNLIALTRGAAFDGEPLVAHVVIIEDSYRPTDLALAEVIAAQVSSCPTYIVNGYACVPPRHVRTRLQAVTSSAVAAPSAQPEVAAAIGTGTSKKPEVVNIAYAVAAPAAAPQDDHHATTMPRTDDTGLLAAASTVADGAFPPLASAQRGHFAAFVSAVHETATAALLPQAPGREPVYPRLQAWRTKEHAGLAAGASVTTLPALPHRQLVPRGLHELPAGVSVVMPVAEQPVQLDAQPADAGAAATAVCHDGSAVDTSPHKLAATMLEQWAWYCAWARFQAASTRARQQAPKQAHTAAEASLAHAGPRTEGNEWAWVYDSLWPAAGGDALMSADGPPKPSLLPGTFRDGAKPPDPAIPGSEEPSTARAALLAGEVGGQEWCAAVRNADRAGEGISGGPDTVAVMGLLRAALDVVSAAAVVSVASAPVDPLYSLGISGSCALALTLEALRASDHRRSGAAPVAAARRQWADIDVVLLTAAVLRDPP